MRPGKVRETRMSRRASLPGAAELFRATSPGGTTEDGHHPGVGAVAAVPTADSPEEVLDRGAAADPGLEHRPTLARVPVPDARRSVRSVDDRLPSGRERHEEKITVYCSAAELIGLESARLQLRAEHGLAVDRGRIVR